MRCLAAAKVATPLVLLVTWGCATAPKDGLRDVQDTVRERSGFAPSWPRQEGTEVQVAERVRTLLGTELTERAAVEIALLNSPRLQATLEELGIARADLMQARRIRNPMLEGEIRFPRRPVAPFEIVFFQQLLDLVQLPKRRSLAQASFAQTKLRVGAEVLDFITEVRSAFFALQAAFQTAQMRRTVADAASTAAELAIRQHDAGNISALDLENEQLLLEEAKLELARAEEEVVAGRERLNRLLGLWGEQTQWKIDPRLSNPPEQELDLAELESLATSQRLELAAAQREVAVAARSLPLVRAGAIGDIGVGVHHEREPDGKKTTGPAIEIPLPLFDRGGAARTRASALFRQAEQRYRALAIDIRAEVREARNRLLAARTRADYYRDVVLPRRSRIVAFSQREYNFMLIGAFELLLAKQNEINAQREAIDALRDYWVARAELEHAVGGSLEVSSEVSASTTETTPPPHPPTDHGDE